MKGFYGSDMKEAHIAPDYILLARTQCLGLINPQKKLKNVDQLCTQQRILPQLVKSNILKRFRKSRIDQNAFDLAYRKD